MEILWPAARARLQVSGHLGAAIISEQLFMEYGFWCVGCGLTASYSGQDHERRKKKHFTTTTTTPYHYHAPQTLFWLHKLATCILCDHFGSKSQPGCAQDNTETRLSSESLSIFKPLSIPQLVYSELPLIWTPEMWPPLYSGHFKMSQSMLPRVQMHP